MREWFLVVFAIAQQPLFTAGGSTPEVHVVSARGLGDANGDGKSDVVIGVPSSGADGASGTVYVLSGADGSVLAAWNGGPGELYGFSVDAAGDVDGDGHVDVLIGAPGAAASKGVVHVRSGATGDVIWAPEGAADGDRFGDSVAGLGDLDLDGFAEFLGGASQPGQGAGYVRVYTGLTGTLASTYVGDAPGDELGLATANGGDMDLDGWPERILGAPGSFAGTGAALVLSGATGLPIASLTGDAPGARFGESVAGGDFNADGHSDFIVGAPS
ncbi:MAG TPA: integrin alpha, partial [Planctomycetota bacterium]|nr:integrin alpha [Planctomycetota bacterium]